MFFSQPVCQKYATVKLDHFPKVRGEMNKCLKPSPRLLFGWREDPKFVIMLVIMLKSKCYFGSTPPPSPTLHRPNRTYHLLQGALRKRLPCLLRIRARGGRGRIATYQIASSSDLQDGRVVLLPSYEGLVRDPCRD